jgi:hypothetical protein
MSLEGRASRFHWGPENDRIRRKLPAHRGFGEGRQSTHSAETRECRE